MHQRIWWRNDDVTIGQMIIHWHLAKKIYYLKSHETAVVHMATDLSLINMLNHNGRHVMKQHLSQKEHIKITQHAKWGSFELRNWCSWHQNKTAAQSSLYTFSYDDDSDNISPWFQNVVLQTCCILHFCHNHRRMKHSLWSPLSS